MVNSSLNLSTSVISRLNFLLAYSLLDDSSSISRILASFAASYFLSLPIALSLSSIALVKSEWKVVLPASTAPFRANI